MLLTRGATLGPYEVIAPLGAGGMGEVYKARDTRLDRLVAIKVLPAAVAGDPQRRDRFRREARAISSLTHAHICTLYDVGEEGGVEFLVMEYLAGETLAQRLLRGPLPIDQVIRVAAQIADALDAAHRHGIVHRDLKPSNVMVTEGGAKVLDFGLARELSVDASAGSAVSQSTVTQAGTIVGTVQYMAPEQLEGKAVDARSDIFAFGAIVYEMTTGRRAFEGTSQSGLIAAILTTTPTSLASFAPMTPPALNHVVRHCLAKSPAERWQSAADLRRELDWVADSLAEVDGATTQTRVRSNRRGRNWAGAAIVIGLVAAFFGLRARPGRIDSHAVRLVLPPIEGVAYKSFNQIQSPPVVSPDGRQIAFVAHQIGQPDALWVRPLDRLEAHVLAGTESIIGSHPFWSPDSRSLGFFAGGKLKRVDLAGGPPRVLADAPDGRGGAWSAEGTIVFAPTPGGALYRVSASGGVAIPVTRLKPSETSHRFPVFLPGGRRFLYFSRGASYESAIEAASLDSADSRTVLNLPPKILNFQ